MDNEEIIIDVVEEIEYISKRYHIKKEIVEDILVGMDVWSYLNGIQDEMGFEADIAANYMRDGDERVPYDGRVIESEEVAAFIADRSDNNRDVVEAVLLADLCYVNDDKENVELNAQIAELLGKA